MKPSMPGTIPERGRLKWKRTEGLIELGKSISPCEHVYGAQRAAHHEWCSRDVRNESRRQHHRAPVRGKPHRASRVRVTSAGISQHEGQVCNAQWFTWRIARKRAFNAINGATLRCQTEGTSVLSTTALEAQGSPGVSTSRRNPARMLRSPRPGKRSTS